MKYNGNHKILSQYFYDIKYSAEYFVDLHIYKLALIWITCI